MLTCFQSESTHIHLYENVGYRSIVGITCNGTAHADTLYIIHVYGASIVILEKQHDKRAYFAGGKDHQSTY